MNNGKTPIMSVNGGTHPFSNPPSNFPSDVRQNSGILSSPPPTSLFFEIIFREVSTAPLFCLVGLLNNFKENSFQIRS